MKTNRLKEILSLCGVNIVLLVIIIVAVELAVRLIFPEINPQGERSDMYELHKFAGTYGLLPNIEGESFGAKIITDSTGFRIDPSLPRRKKEKETILVLGDSVTLGIGVDACDTYPFMLQRMLRDCRIINAAATGYFVSDYINVLKTILPKLDVDGVIIGLCLNDFSNLSQAHIKEVLNEDYKLRYPNPIVRFLKYISTDLFDFNKYLRVHSRAYRLIKHLSTDTSKNYFLADYAYYNIPQNQDLIAGELMRLRDLLKAEKKWIILFILPYEYQLREAVSAEADITKPQRMITEIASAEGLEAIDLLPFYKKACKDLKGGPKSLYLFDDAMHFSAEGHEVAARAIYSKLKKRGLVK